MSIEMSDYATYIHKSRYARWRDDLGRRETWDETVERYINFFEKKSGILTSTTYDSNGGSNRNIRDALSSAILNLEVMPSMRALMTAGEALDRDNVAGFNCSYTAVSGDGEEIELIHEKLDTSVLLYLSKPIDFDECMYILMCGTGVGFSVESQYTEHLPVVGKPCNRRVYLPYDSNYPGVSKEELSRFDKKQNTIFVHDSKYGWASALRILLIELYNGNFNIKWDVSSVRPAGERLKTFGGRASGPEPLVDLFKFAVPLFKAAYGRKLRPIECHDLMCKIADIVVVGGVRRSALISLSDLNDEEMRLAKSGEWWDEPDKGIIRYGYRALANNSVCYQEKPPIGVFMDEWLALYRSRSGERGIFNREASQRTAERNKRREYNRDFGTNPLAIK